MSAAFGSVYWKHGGGRLESKIRCIDTCTALLEEQIGHSIPLSTARLDALPEDVIR